MVLSMKAEAEIDRYLLGTPYVVWQRFIQQLVIIV
jgi:hypothetical protein